MVKSLSVVPLGLLLLCTAARADTMRCGSQLVSEGDRAFEVEEKCGRPIYRDQIGYTLGPSERREMLIEEWVYGPTNGVHSILTFEGNRLTRIERRRTR
ncbi:MULTISPECIES: DUF2845 domain-containing protein [Pseudomonas]|uniref:DUF2845 domain-containing protein n=1 Tax=Pseudomonas TaxID=286 RepID=UPI000C0E403D|nr:hypothetical protein [Pseudomonadaceae bacterium]HCP54353.1 hypothetical protein [Pseudomonas sp.]|tara:strand:- start:923 stop:1219 length:297 start_codon:yes stop_codon:yes gene_type:complete